MKIWFVVGVSGAGKSYFSEYAAGHFGFFHYEIDQTPHDGITHFGLRSQWDKFLDEFGSAAQIKELTKRSCVSGCPGAILSFPANLVGYLTADHLASLAGKAKLVVLTGEPEGLELDVAVPAIEQGALLGGGASGLRPILSARERATALASALRS